MLFKKIFCSLLSVLLFFNFFTVAAARTGEPEKQFVEFKALVPDNLTAPIQIELTDKNTKTVLNYYLYSVNSYFNNEGVVLGDYTVKVSVAYAKETDFNFIYDKELNVVQSATAIPFTIIIDDASLIGDAEGNKDINFKAESIKNENETSNEILSDNSNVISSSENVVSDNSEDVNASSKDSSNSSVIVSLIISILIIVLGIFLFWFIKKRNLV